MTILVVLAGLVLSHLLGSIVTRWRHFDWLLWPIEQLRQRFSDQGWVAMAMVLAVSLLASWLAVWLVTTMLGVFGWALLALLAFIYALGPRDLDADVQLLLERDGGEEPLAVAEAARSMRLETDAWAPETAAAVFHAAVARWFGILFWFVVLGVAGAVLYRLTRVTLQLESLRPTEIEWLARLRIVLDWPVLLLTILSAGLCGDLDRVYRAWNQGRESPWWLTTPAMLDRVAAVHVEADEDFDAGLRAGHRMVWRMLILWLVVMSLLLLAGWLT